MKICIRKTMNLKISLFICETKSLCKISVGQKTPQL